MATMYVDRRNIDQFIQAVGQHLLNARRELEAIFAEIGLDKSFLPHPVFGFDANDPLKQHIRWRFFFDVLKSEGLPADLSAWTDEQVSVVFRFLRAYANRHPLVSNQPFLAEGFILDDLRTEWDRRTASDEVPAGNLVLTQAQYDELQSRLDLLLGDAIKQRAYHGFVPNDLQDQIDDLKSDLATARIQETVE